MRPTYSPRPSSISCQSEISFNLLKNEFLMPKPRKVVLESSIRLKVAHLKLLSATHAGFIITLTCLPGVIILVCWLMRSQSVALLQPVTVQEFPFIFR